MKNKLPENISLKPLPFEEAIAFFRSKLLLSSAEFYALSDAAQAKAFVISGIARMDILKDVYEAVGTAIEAGETVADFKGRLGGIMETKGWKGLAPWRVDNIFRTNIQTAYSTGRYKQMKAQVDRFPYWEYDAVNDSRTRPTHGALDGKIFPSNHQFWDTWYPPNGYRCRCSVQPVHKYVAEEERLKIETEDPTGKLIEPVDADGNKMPARHLIPDPGWDHNPAKEAWKPDLKKYPPELVKQFESVKKE